MIKLGSKVKAAMTMVAASSPSKVRGDFRWCSASCGVVLEKSGEGEAKEGPAVGDIKVHDRVTGEILEFDDAEKKGWWMRHPITGVFIPCEQEALHVTMVDDGATIKSSTVELQEE